MRTEQEIKLLTAVELALKAKENTKSKQELIYYFIQFPFAIDQTIKGE